MALYPVRWLILFTFSPLISVLVYSQELDHSSSGLFDRDEVLSIRLSGNMRELLKDRSNDMQYHDIRLSYKEADSSLVSLSIKVKTRGNFRRTQGFCVYPPLLLNFTSSQSHANSLFHHQRKLKLVTPCSGDKYVVREYLVYKLYNLVTPRSFRARLVKVTYDDTVKGKASEALYGILLEDEDELAMRNHVMVIKNRLLRPDQTRRDDFSKMAVFEYMIGNTDWSVQYFQNVKLVAPDSSGIPSPVPYDFDHAGIVGAPYANPAEALLLSSTRERRYRGYCVNEMSSFNETFALFNKLKDDLLNVYTECPLIDAGYKKATVRYLEEFYKTINNPKFATTEFSYPCDKEGTGNVVIKGMKAN